MWVSVGPRRVAALITGLAALAAGPATAAPPDAQALLARVLDADPWGLAGAEVSARAIVTDARGRKRTLAFTGRSRRHDPPLAKSVVRFSAPADLDGVAFLQVQNADGDDHRFLYLPELGRARRIAGKLRAQAFMGTDFSYADLDRRDLRNGKAELRPDTRLGKYPVHHIVVTPKDADSPYGKVEIWIRKDNGVPVKWEMTSRSGVRVKTLVAREIRRVAGRWFVTRSVMKNHTERQTTELILDRIEPTDRVPDEVFTVSELER